MEVGRVDKLENPLDGIGLDPYLGSRVGRCIPELSSFLGLGARSKPVEYAFLGSIRVRPDDAAEIENLLAGKTEETSRHLIARKNRLVGGSGGSDQVEVFFEGRSLCGP